MTEQLRDGLRTQVLPAGLLLFLCGLFLVPAHEDFSRLVYAALLLPSLLLLALERPAWRDWAHRPVVALLFGAFLLYINASVLWASGSTEPDPYWKYALYILLFMHALAWAAVPEAPCRQVLRWSVWLAGLSVLPALVAYYGLDQVNHRRFHGLALTHPLLTGNVYGLFLVLGLVDQCRAQSWRRRVPGLAAMALVTLAVVLTQSRSPMLGVMLAGFFLIVWHGGRWRPWILGLTGVGVIAFAVLYEPFLARGLSQRPAIWSTVFDQALAHPWIGHGLSVEPVFERRYSTLFDAHNIELAVFFYGGAVGVLLWLAVLAGCGVRAWQARHTFWGQLALACLLYGLATTAFEGGYFISRPKANWFYLWLPLALCLRLERTRGR